MRVAVFPMMLGRRAGGPETYESNLLRAIAGVDPEAEVCVYCLSPAAPTRASCR